MAYICPHDDRCELHRHDEMVLKVCKVCMISLIASIAMHLDEHHGLKFVGSADVFAEQLRDLLEELRGEDVDETTH